MDTVDQVDIVDTVLIKLKVKILKPKPELLIPNHGGYRNLKSFQLAQFVFDISIRFCEKYIDPYSRTKDQMVQAARSGVQNIAEGSQASATSKKTELKLTQVARASLEELKLDYEDFLRQKNLELWSRDHPLRQNLVNQRCKSADAVANWVIATAKQNNQMATRSILATHVYPEYSANATLALINVACYLLDQQVKKLAEDFTTEGGFTERLYRVRKTNRVKNNGY